MSQARQTVMATVLGAALSVGASSVLGQAGNEWATYGGDQGNTRYSTLNQINTSNVKNLKVKWIQSLGTTDTQESTPLIIDGTMYVTSSTGPKYVFALDAKTGAIKWRYEPELPNDFYSTICCGMDNRGVAYADGRLFFGRLDAKMEAIDAKTGKRLWQVTVQDYKKGHAITSPPLIVKNTVVTGIAGGEYGIRGFLVAYDQKTGKEVWKTYTIPGPGEPGNDSWIGDTWKTGSGSTWGVGSYDAKLNHIYWSTSNAGPWGGHKRSTDSSDFGKYSNLWTASQLAFDADTGKIVWGYQFTPNDVWDYDGINEAVLMDMDIGGQKVPVITHADRNGFFYVINRQTGKLVSASPFVTVNWATHVDLATGRPVEAPNNEKRPQLGKWARHVCPNLMGGKNWPPMSHSMQSGLNYFPAFNMCMDMATKDEEYTPGKFFLASEFNLDMAGHSGSHLGEFLAWDPKTNKKVWGIQEELPFIGGAMTTAGGLVFYGNQYGEVKAVNAQTGEILWRFNAGSGVMQSPVTFAIDGKQYIAIVAGRSVGVPSFFGKIGERIVNASTPGGHVMVLSLD